MLELYLWLTLKGTWGTFEETEVSVSPTAVYEDVNWSVSVEPTTLNWTPAHGFWFSYQIQGGPRIYLLEGDSEYVGE